VADSDAMADGQENAFIRVAHAQILDICSFTNGDRVQIPPDDRLEPDGRISADTDIADDLGGGGDKHGWVNPGGMGFKSVQWHGEPYFNLVNTQTVNLNDVLYLLSKK
jgi:hypothetical protein